MRTNDAVHASLGEFVAALRLSGDLVTVDAPVDPDLEITEIADRCIKTSTGGPALFFTNVKNSKMPLLINAFAAKRRMEFALGVRDLSDLGDKVRGLLKLLPTGGSGSPNILSALLGAKDFMSIFPRPVRGAPCQEIVEQGDDVDLNQLPVIRCWPLDAGPFITLPLVFTKDPKTGSQNCGVYRMQVYDRRTTGMHWQKHKHGREHQLTSSVGSRMPVAVAIGADPVVTFSGTAPLPAGFDELTFAGFLRGRGVPVVSCRTVDLKVPAEAEIVLEGFVDNAELRREGPFGDHTGVYSLADDFPVFHVTCMTRRRSPIYHTTIVGRPPMEDAWLGKATERLFLPILQQLLPEVVDYNLPIEGGFHNLAIVSVRKRYPGQAKKVMYALWGLGHMMMLTRNILVVDEDVDVADIPTVAWFALNNVDAGRDLVFAPGPVDELDHAGPLPLLGTKLGIDATRKGRSEGYQREWPPDIVMSEDIKDRVARRWEEYGLASLVPQPLAGPPANS